MDFDPVLGHRDREVAAGRGLFSAHEPSKGAVDVLQI